jgi:hypothetical protein
MMKIKLIAPHEQREDTLSGSFKLQRVNLPLLAALTPFGHTMTIVDEAFAPDDINQDVDLVGITVMTDLALRAYHIADAYRRKGVKVVMGGIHPTVLPDEALEYADAVVVGEAEGIWPRLGMSPWKRTLFGCQVYAGVNLSTRKRYFKGLRNPQPFAGASNSIGKQ